MEYYSLGAKERQEKILQFLTYFANTQCGEGQYPAEEIQISEEEEHEIKELARRYSQSFDRLNRTIHFWYGETKRVPHAPVIRREVAE